MLVCSAYLAHHAVQSSAVAYLLYCLKLIPLQAWGQVSVPPHIIKPRNTVYNYKISKNYRKNHKEQIRIVVMEIQHCNFSVAHDI